MTETEGVSLGSLQGPTPPGPLPGLLEITSYLTAARSDSRPVQLISQVFYLVILATLASGCHLSVWSAGHVIPLTVDSEQRPV